MPIPISIPVIAIPVIPILIIPILLIQWSTGHALQ
ncbi:hypothetical protein A2U01_0047311, partial [Trifolium medium]|nr:hypothetical protein [Trifolium medium]